MGDPREGPAPRGLRTPLRKAPQKREQRREQSLALEEGPAGVSSSGGLCGVTGAAEGAGAAVVVAQGGPRRLRVETGDI